MSFMFTLALIVLAEQTTFAGEVIRASNGAEVRKALTSVRPGDIIELVEGSIDLKGTVNIDKSGEAGEPLTLRASTRGKTEFVGQSRFLLDAVAHVVLDGFVFSSVEGPAIEMRACNNVRITRNTFHLRETRKSSWVLITGSKTDVERISHHNRVDHNLFEQKHHLGNFITVEGSRKTPYQVSQFDTIDRNHFRDIGPRVENVLEAIRIGSSDFSLSSGYTLIEKNLFERCDGDPEYVSIKSSDNIVRQNTFRECLGSLSLRHGNRNTIEGNFILGNGRAGTFRDSTGKTWTLGTGGVRFYGDGMVIVNNCFAGLTGSRWDGTLSITNGDAEYGDGQPLTKHFRIHDAVVAFNTFVDNRSGIEIGYDGEGFQGNWWHLPPAGIIIANNLIVGSHGPLIELFAEAENATWKGNIAFVRGGGVVSRTPLAGVNEIDPSLAQGDCFWRLQNDSPAVDAALGAFPSVVLDIDGQRRDARKDVGADEMSEDTITNRPLNGEDVGPESR